MIDSQGNRTQPVRRAQRRASPPGRLRLALAAVAALVVLGGGALVAAIPQEGLDRAIAAQRALALERPADATVREDLGSLLSLAGDLAGAEAAYREAIALSPSSAGAHFKLGGILERLGHEKKALSEYREAIDLDPGHAWAHYEAGTIWAHWGLDRLARNSYARALALDPSLLDPQVNPHILENRHATSAMILAYREYLPESGAPPTFHEPARIAGLILEKPATEDRLAGEPAAKPEEAERAGGYARSMGGERAAAGAAESDGGDEDAKTLTTRDLDPSSKAGQVMGGTGVGTVGGSRGRSTTESAAERAKAREAARQAARPARTPSGGVVYPQNPGYSPQPAAPGGGGGFVPAPDSSGRIEVRLDERAG